MEKVIVVGSGVMGSGIAMSSILAGYETLIYDVKTDALQKATQYIHQQIQVAVDKGKITEDQKIAALNKLSFTEDKSTLTADFIIEAILENLTIKRELFQHLENLNNPNTIFATNTSSIPITQIANGLKHPERLVGVHFFNPAHIMKLVEIIQGAATNPEIAEKAFNWAKSLGKTAVYTKDAPGFIVNRVARHFYVEALKIAEEGVTDFKTIDKLVESTGFKMGPFKLMDLIGVETNYSVTNSMFEQFNFDPKFRPNRIQKQKVDAGHHGKKSGQGFYKYD
jgi:3-hydroxybutyryl-CoA dehydrogenase